MMYSSIHPAITILIQVIFRDGEGALQVFPSLVGVIPEARLNLVIYHLRQGSYLYCEPAALPALITLMTSWR